MSDDNTNENGGRQRISSVMGIMEIMKKPSMVVRVNRSMKVQDIKLHSGQLHKPRSFLSKPFASVHYNVMLVNVSFSAC